MKTIAKKRWLMVLVFMGTIAFSTGKTLPKQVFKNMPLQFTRWTLISINRNSVEEIHATTEAFIVFDTNNRYYGNFGCNQFFGQYFASKKKIKIDYAGATKKMCAYMELEIVFSKALHQEISLYTIVGATLILFDAQRNEIARFAGKSQPKQELKMESQSQQDPQLQE